MDKKAPKKINKNIPHQLGQNNQQKFPKKSNINENRPITGVKPINKQKINLNKKSNTPKKVSIINLNEEISLKESKNSKNNNVRKISAKEQNKKPIGLNTNKANNNLNQSNKEQKELGIIDQLSNLRFNIFCSKRRSRNISK